MMMMINLASWLKKIDFLTFKFLFRWNVCEICFVLFISLAQFFLIVVLPWFHPFAWLIRFVLFLFSPFFLLLSFWIEFLIKQIILQKKKRNPINNSVIMFNDNDEMINVANDSSPSPAQNNEHNINVVIRLVFDIVLVISVLYRISKMVKKL